MKESDLKRIVHQSPDIICTIDGDGRFIRVNQASELLLGYSPAELEGEHFMAFVCEEDVSATEQIARQIMEGRVVTQFENRYVRKDRTLMPLTWSARWNKEEKKMYAIARDARDAREKRELETAYRERNRILESIGDAFFAVDPDWVVTYWNGEAERILQRPREEILGKNLWAVYHDAVELDFYREYHRAMETGEIVRFEEFYPATGSWFEVTAYPSIEGLSIYFRDVTERKQAEAEMLELNRQLQIYSERLEGINQDLEQFAYVASHDLQEPLRMVTSFLTKLERRLGNRLDETSGTYLHYAVDGARRMRQVILDLLDYSRAGESARGQKKTDLKRMTHHVWQTLDARVQQTNGRLKTDFRDLRIVQTDPVLLERILQNLISNALKYHREGVSPEIKVSSRKSKNGWELSVSDNGLGMEEEYLDKIFVIFQRLHAKEEYDGTGIGLAIVKKMVRQLKGRIDVTSTPGVGSTFRIHFPMASR